MRGTHRCPALGLLGIAAILAGTADAQRVLEIDPAESRIRVLATSGIWLDLVEPLGPIFLPFESQPGADGALAALDGHLLVVETLDFGSPTFGIQGGSIEPLSSGSWRPGLPASSGVAAPAAIGVAWSSALLDGEGALRDLSLTANGSDLVEAIVPGARWRWPTPPFDGPGAPQIELRVTGGVVDLDLPLISNLRLGLYETIEKSLRIVQPGEIRRAGGKLQLALPVDLSTELGANDLETALPIRVRLDLHGRIVATEAGYVPEPGAALQICVACAALAAIARRRS